MKNETVQVGVGVMIFKDGKILLGKRKGSHGEGEYAFTGGYLEHNESFEGCARRETLEEAGITIKNVDFLCLANVDKFLPQHILCIGVTAQWESGEPKVLELDKRESWAWYDLDNLPGPLFYPTKIMIDAYNEGKFYYDKT